MGGRGLKQNVPRGFLLPVESSCRPTSKDSLSVCDLDVFRQARYCVVTTDITNPRVRQTDTSGHDPAYTMPFHVTIEVEFLRH